ncbi:MAG: alpha-amylase, partial [Treponema sp.]|nr:alpha-amylase [Treponema sp.]
MPDKLSLMLAFHGHLCAGADDSRFEHYYGETLRPFITALNRHPKIPCTLHLSGSLLERLEQKKKECFLLIREMAGRKQIELLGGGFYEPLLPLLPVNDRIGQIEMLTTFLRKSFGRRPVGCKLFLNAWEQSLAGLLASCGMNFTFLSEEQFSLCGE